MFICDNMYIHVDVLPVFHANRIHICVIVLITDHWSGIIWESCRVKTSAIRPLVQQLDQYGSPHKGTAMPKAFTCHDVIVALQKCVEKMILFLFPYDSNVLNNSQ